MYRHDYTHERLGSEEWDALVVAVEWLLVNCPACNDGPGSRNPSSPLRDNLITASMSDSPDGGLILGNKVNIDHGAPSFLNPVRGRPHIVINGTWFFGQDYLALGASAVSEVISMNTGGKPYDLIVCAILILANHLHPGKWHISSTAGVQTWNNALTLARGYAPSIHLPAGVQSAFGQDSSTGREIPVPAGMDFRA